MTFINVLFVSFSCIWTYNWLNTPQKKTTSKIYIKLLIEVPLDRKGEKTFTFSWNIFFPKNIWVLLRSKIEKKIQFNFSNHTWPTYLASNFPCLIHFPRLWFTSIFPLYCVFWKATSNLLLKDCIKKNATKCIGTIIEVHLSLVRCAEFERQK